MKRVIWLDSHSILVKWRNNFAQIFNVNEVIVVRQREIHSAQPLVPESSAFEDEVAIEKLKRHKSPGTDQISAELIKAGGRKIRSEIHKLINYIWNKEELLEEWKESIVVRFYEKGDKTDFVITEAYHFCQLRTKFYPTTCCHV